MSKVSQNSLIAANGIPLVQFNIENAGELLKSEGTEYALFLSPEGSSGSVNIFDSDAEWTFFQKDSSGNLQKVNMSSEILRNTLIQSGSCSFLFLVEPQFVGATYRLECTCELCNESGSFTLASGTLG